MGAGHDGAQLPGGRRDHGGVEARADNGEHGTETEGDPGPRAHPLHRPEPRGIMPVEQEAGEDGQHGGRGEPA